MLTKSHLLPALRGIICKKLRILILLNFITVSLTFGQTFELQLNPQTYAGGYNISCNGILDGGIDLVVIGGTAPYSYEWSTGATTQDLNNLAAGTYTVTVTDALNNIASSQKTLSQPQVLYTNLIPTHVTIFGQSNGRISQEINGGTPPYAYLWNTGSIASTLTGIPIGNYTVTVTDANGCTDQKSVTIIQPNQLILSIISISNVTCPRGRNGSIDVNIIGGIPPYMYSWSTGDFSQDINDIPAGDYTLRVTDQGGATVESSTLTITQPAEFNLNLSSPTYLNGYNVSCSECFNGSVSSSISGGSLPYSYVWSDGQSNIGTQNSISNISGGVYKLIITDNIGCIASKEINLREAPPRGWGREGNAGITSTEFLGTVDNADVNIRTNNIEIAKFNTDGKLLINEIVVERISPKDSLIFIGSNSLQFNNNSNNVEAIPFTNQGGLYFGGLGLGHKTWGKGFRSSAFGHSSICNNDYGVAVGNFVRSSADNAIVIGSGYNNGANNFVNDITNSIMIGMNSVNPTIFVSPGGNPGSGATGAVGINTTYVPIGYKLAVDGDIICEKLVVRQRGLWPDFVFDKGHNKMSLKELELFVYENKRLPGLPSAKEISVTGQDIAGIQLELVKLNEELLIHIIEMNKKIDYLENCLKDLRK